MIRLKTLAWIEENGELFVVRNHDSVKGDDYYRPIGGSVNFGERTVDALRREVQEELGTTISITGEPLIIENIFTCDGKAGHEIDYLFPAQFDSPEFYERRIFDLVEEGGERFDALWVSIDDCLEGKYRLVPEELLAWYRSGKKQR
ncbi:MAG TPA: NUDIX domain-containing protein [Anaerolineaceae bacterium]|nr:NUDIX domain-containing protein [Anaerolineaceae bacterium]